MSERIPLPYTGALVAVVVTYRSAPEIADCVGSVAAELSVNDAIAVVDNASPDCSAPLIEAALRAQRALAGRWDFVASSVNLGFGKACNLAAERFPGNDVLLVNPDAVLTPGSVAALRRALAADPLRGAAGPRIQRLTGEDEPGCRRALPRPFIAAARLGRLDRLSQSRFGAYNCLGEDPLVAADLEAGSGCCVLIRRTAWDALGGFDPRFFMYGEDLDLFLRMGRAGWTVRYVPEALVKHRKGASTGRARARMVVAFHHAMWVYYRKHHLRGWSALLAPLVVAGLTSRAAGTLAMGLMRRPPHRVVSRDLGKPHPLGVADPVAPTSTAASTSVCR